MNTDNKYNLPNSRKSKKRVRFDPNIKVIDNTFNGIETLIDQTLDVGGFDEIRKQTYEEKKTFFENEILKSEPIFFVLDNLVNIEDEEFFNYITKNFNQLAAKNPKLKVSHEATGRTER